MILLIFIFCHSIFLAIHFAISKDGLALYKKISKTLCFLQPFRRALCLCPLVPFGAALGPVLWLCFLLRFFWFLLPLPFGPAFNSSLDLNNSKKGAPGFEPGTCRSAVCRYGQLSYTPMIFVIVE